MSLLLARLQRALSPQFTVEREIAGGGMGVVFLGHDRTLDRAVAIKLLRPEGATAAGVERFLREARILARLRHPNILPVFQGGEADGLLYHILEYQPGETLAQRLVRGPLAPAELGELADGLLAALEAAHGAGVIHRDIKPSNIFLADGRAVVADFGIARTDTGGEVLTASDAVLGTRAYMAPEQARGGECTVRADLHSAGLVLAEAATGQPPARLLADLPGALAGLPPAWRRSLRRALSTDPAKRWPDAASFRASLRAQGMARRPVLAMAAVVVALAAVAFWAIRPGPPSVQFVVEMAPFQAQGDAQLAAAAAELHGRMIQAMTGFPDWVVRGERGAAMPGSPPSLRLDGTVRERDGRLEVTLAMSRPGRGATGILRGEIGRELPAVGVDSLVLGVLMEIWRGTHPGEALPREALPRTPDAFRLFLEADRAYAAGAWGLALETYESVERADSTCVLCAYRIRDLHRWLSQESDTLRLRQLVSGVDRFPAPYRALIRASALPPGLRLDTLLAQRDRIAGFFDFHYVLGDELLHRGPLHGLPRRDAIEQLQQAMALRPEFSGVIEHLVWAHVAEGDSAQAAELLGILAARHAPQDPFTAGLRTLHQLGFVWRFLPPEAARAATQRALSDEVILASRDLPAGPRVLPAFGAPAGAVAFGKDLAAIRGRPELRRAGLLAQAFGWVALGRPDTAVRLVQVLAADQGDPGWDYVAVALPAWLAVIGEGPKLEAEARVREALRRGGWRGGLEDRLQWWLALLAGERMRPAGGGGDGQEPLRRLAAAAAIAEAGQPGRALELVAPLTDTDFRRGDPFAPSVARLLRARWLEATGRPNDAQVELLWHEHSDLDQIPRGDLQAAEVDWAAGTFAMWRRARLLAEGDPVSAEPCPLWAEVERRWRAGLPRYTSLAEAAAAERRARPACRLPP